MEAMLAKIRQLDKQKLMALGIAAAVLVGLDVFFILQMQFKQAAQAKVKIVELQRSIADIERSSREVAARKQEEEKSKVRPKKLVSEADLPLLLQEISSTAKSNNVKVAQIVHSKESRPATKEQKGQPAAGQPDIIPLLIRLDLVCGYHSFGAFLAALEQSDVAFACEDFRITNAPGEYQKERVTMGVRTFLKK